MALAADLPPRGECGTVHRRHRERRRGERAVDVQGEEIEAFGVDGEMAAPPATPMQTLERLVDAPVRSVVGFRFLKMVRVAVGGVLVMGMQAVKTTDRMAPMSSALRWNTGHLLIVARINR